jgi:hypothetical protein
VAAGAERTLDDRAMTELDALEEGLVTGWDPGEQP